MHPHPSHSIVPPAIGFGTFGSAKELNDRLNWWTQRPKLAATQHGQQRIATLTAAIKRQSDGSLLF